MRFLIEEVKNAYIGTDDPDDVSSFLVYGITKGGLQLKLSDSEPFDFRKLINEELNLLIFVSISNNPNDIIKGAELYSPVLEGVYLGEYKIQEKWQISWTHQSFKKLNKIEFHAIQANDGIFIISPKNIGTNHLEKGDVFKYKVIGCDIMAWERIEDERVIDSLAYEKNFIERFWRLIKTTREKCDKDSEIQKELIYKELLNWSYNENWLFGDILNHLTNELRFDTILEGLFKESVNKWGNFCRGIVALGREAFNDALSNKAKFSHYLKTGVYAESNKSIESSLYTLVQDVVEKKSGKSVDIVQDLYLRQDIDNYQKRIYDILNEDFKINQD